MVHATLIRCLKVNEMEILRRAKKGSNKSNVLSLVEKRKSEELMSLQGLKEFLDGPARAIEVQLYEHVLKRVLDFEVVGRRGRRRPNMMWKRQVEKHTNQIGLKKENVIDRTMWCDGVHKLSRNMSEFGHLC